MRFIRTDSKTEERMEQDVETFVKAFDGMMAAGFGFCCYLPGENGIVDEFWFKNGMQIHFIHVTLKLGPIYYKIPEGWDWDNPPPGWELLQDMEGVH